MKIAFVRQRRSFKLKPGSCGFALIELLAAFVIFAIGFGVMMELTSSSLRKAKNGAETTEAALWAQSKLDTAGFDEALQPGSSTGEFNDKYSWEMNISEWEPPSDAAQFPGEAPIELYQISLVVYWGEGEHEHQARFVTVRALQPGNLQS